MWRFHNLYLMQCVLGELFLFMGIREDPPDKVHTFPEPISCATREMLNKCLGRVEWSCHDAQGLLGTFTNLPKYFKSHLSIPFTHPVEVQCKCSLMDNLMRPVLALDVWTLIGYAMDIYDYLGVKTPNTLYKMYKLDVNISYPLDERKFGQPSWHFVLVHLLFNASLVTYLSYMAYRCKTKYFWQTWFVWFVNMLKWKRPASNCTTVNAETILRILVENRDLAAAAAGLKPL